MPVEIGFCDQCRELTCDDPEVCAQARTCQIAADGLRDLADVVEASHELAVGLNHAAFGVLVGSYGRTPDQVREAYRACVAALGPTTETTYGRRRMFGPVRFEVYGPADILNGEVRS